MGLAGERSDGRDGHELRPDLTSAPPPSPVPPPPPPSAHLPRPPHPPLASAPPSAPSAHLPRPPPRLSRPPRPPPGSRVRPLHPSSPGTALCMSSIALDISIMLGIVSNIPRGGTSSWQPLSCRN